MAYKALHNRQIGRTGNALYDLFPSTLRDPEAAHKGRS